MNAALVFLLHIICLEVEGEYSDISMRTRQRGIKNTTAAAVI